MIPQNGILLKRIAVPSAALPATACEKRPRRFNRPGAEHVAPTIERRTIVVTQSKNPQVCTWGFCFVRSLTMTYFHIRTYTIIGAESFHCPVRDGKEWGQLAMVVRHNWRLIDFPVGAVNRPLFGRSKAGFDCCERNDESGFPVSHFPFHGLLNVIGSSLTGN